MCVCVCVCVCVYVCVCTKQKKNKILTSTDIDPISGCWKTKRLSTEAEATWRRKAHVYIGRVREEEQEIIVQELCESRGGRPGLSVLTSLLVSVDVKQY